MRFLQKSVAKIFFVLLIAFGFGLAGPAAQACPMRDAETQKEVNAALENWGDAIASRNPSQIVALYREDAVLLATLANQPILSQDGRMAYFGKLVKRESLRVTDWNGVVETGKDYAVANGTYVFRFKDKDGKDASVPARYTFVFTPDAKGEWRILTHHSSMLPEQK